MEATVQQILECEMDEALQARRGERNDERLGHRSGSYDRSFVTRVGKLELRIPQDRKGLFRTELFDPPRSCVGTRKKLDRELEAFAKRPLEEA